MILSCQNISKAFVENQVLKNVSFHIEDHEKAAIVGINGAGKTTLLRIIVGEMTPDDGQVVLAKDKTLGYLAQNSTVDTSHTIYEELLSVKADLLRLEEKIRECENNMKHADGDALEDLMKQYTSLTHAFETGGGYLYRSELVGVLKGLGFTEDEFSKPVATLSGGQKTRVALGRLLLQNPDLIILDEPTNHLDYEMVEWLEDYLRRFRGAIIMITHDRYFLDSVCNRIVEVDKGQTYSYDTNYSGFLELKAAREESERASERKRQSILRKEIEWMQRGARARSTKQKAHIQRYEALRDQKGPQTDGKVELSSVSSRMGRTTIELHDISKAYGDIVCVKDFTYIFLKNDRIGFVGKNGCGKSTLMKIIAGFIEPDSGEVEIGQTIKIGYFGQEVDIVHIVGGLLQEQAARLLRVAIPAVVIDAAVGHVVDGLHHGQAAQPAALHNALHLLRDGGKAQREADHHPVLAPLGGGAQLGQRAVADEYVDVLQLRKGKG